MKKTWLQRVQLLIGWLTLFFIGTDLFVVSPLLPNIARQFHVSASEAGWMVTAFSLMYALGAPWFGTLSDRWGRQKMIILGLAGFSVANLITGLTTTFSLLLGSRILAGLFASMITSSVFAIVGDSAPEGRRGGWLSIVTSGFLTALWTGAPIGTLIGQTFGWRVIFITLSIVTIMLVVLNAWVWPTKTKQSNEDSRILGKNRIGMVLINVTVTMFWAFAVYGLYTYLGTGLSSVNHFSSGTVALSLVVYGVGAIVGSLAGGRLADIWHAKVVSMTGMVVLGIALILTGLFFSSNVWLWPILVLWAFAGYVSFSAFQAYLAVVFPKQLGTAMAWNQTAMYTGITFGSVFGSIVIDNWPFNMLPILCGIIAFIGAGWLHLSARSPKQ